MILIQLETKRKMSDYLLKNLEKLAFCFKNFPFNYIITAYLLVESQAFAQPDINLCATTIAPYGECIKGKYLLKHRVIFK
jgi:hypothetical protein